MAAWIYTEQCTINTSQAELTRCMKHVKVSLPQCEITLYL